MARIEQRLDEAIDRLALGEEAGHDPELAGLLGLARAVKGLPAGDWPDEGFEQRLVDGLAAELGLAPAAPRRMRVRLRLRLALAAAAVLAGALAAVVALETSSSVSAATLARRALAASRGSSLGPVSFTQVVTNIPPRGVFAPEPPPPRIVERALYAAPDRWRVEATITAPGGEGRENVLTVRDGATIVSVTRSASGTTETRRRAAAGADLPGATAFGAQLDPLSLLAAAKGACVRPLGPVRSGPEVAGRTTSVITVGATPCPSASLAALNGPARFVIDRRTDLVLSAELHATNGQLTERLQTSALRTGVAVGAGAFRLPAPLPVHRVPPVSLPPNPSRAALRARSAFTPLLPAHVPAGLEAGPVTPVETQPSTGKLLAFTITYRGARGAALFQLYEAAASRPNVRFPGRPVPLGGGVTATYLDRNGLEILWWVEHGTYISIQQGGVAGGVRLTTRFPLATLRAVARSMS